VKKRRNENVRSDGRRKRMSGTERRRPRKTNVLHLHQFLPQQMVMPSARRGKAKRKLPSPRNLKRRARHSPNSHQRTLLLRRLLSHSTQRKRSHRNHNNRQHNHQHNHPCSHPPYHRHSPQYQHILQQSH